MEKLSISKLLRRDSLENRSIEELMGTAVPRDLHALLNDPGFSQNLEFQQTIANRFFLPNFPTIGVPRPSFGPTESGFILQSIWGNRKFSVPQSRYEWDPLIPHHWNTITKPSAYLSFAVNIPLKLVEMSWGYVNVRNQLAYDEKKVKVKRNNDEWYTQVQREVSDAIKSGLIEYS